MYASELSCHYDKNGITEYTPDLVRDDTTDDKHDRNMKGTFHHQQSTVLWKD